ncbi:MAG: hypothetical protein AAFX10_17305 [Pseudomonadota bacterium]
MAPIYRAFAGTHVAAPAKPFVERFGRRGLVSIIFTVSNGHPPDAAMLSAVVIATMVLGFVAQGPSADVLADVLRRWASRRGA